MSATLMDLTVDLIPDRWGFSANDKHILVQLGRYADNDTDDCFPGMPDVAKRTGLSVDTVRRCIRALADGGWLAILPQERKNGATSSHLYRLNYAQIVAARATQKEEEAAAKRASAPPGTVLPPPSKVPGGPLHGARGNITDKQLKDSLSGADAQREVWRDLADKAMEAAGEAADTTSPGIITIYPLTCLLTDSPASPACTLTEIIEGVRKAAAWYLQRGLAGKMRNWEMAERMACELRDKRLRGFPVAETPKPKPGEGLGDPADFGPDKWRSILNLANLRRTWQADDWGPPPGEAGSFVPADLVDMWKGKAA